VRGLVTITSCSGLKKNWEERRSTQGFLDRQILEMILE
jgi:hypothetical protein